MQHSVGTDEERSAALLVAAAEALLTAQNPSVPSDFIAGLFGRVAPVGVAIRSFGWPGARSAMKLQADSVSAASSRPS